MSYIGLSRPQWGDDVKRVDPFYVSKPWQELRAKALRRDKYICLHCGAKCIGAKKGGVSPHVDHIQTIRDRPDLKLSLSNLRTLCHSCHSKVTANARHGQDRPTIGIDGYPL